MSTTNEPKKEVEIYYAAPLESSTPLETTGSLETSTPLESVQIHRNIEQTRIVEREEAAIYSNDFTEDVDNYSRQQNYPNALSAYDVYDASQQTPAINTSNARANVVEPVTTSQQVAEVNPNANATNIVEPTTSLQNVTPSYPSALDTDTKFEGTVSLLEERVVVQRYKHKVGEVIIRKEIQTEIVKVPIKREKLIVEQVNPEYKRLATVDLDEEQVQRTSREVREAVAMQTNTNLDVDSSAFRAEFKSVKLASQFLSAIANLPRTGCEKVQIVLDLTDPQMKTTYEQWLSRFIAAQNHTPNL